jgi:hypothetical protein
MSGECLAARPGKHDAVTEHTYALFVLVGINPDCEPQGPRIGIETNLKSRFLLWWRGKKMARSFLGTMSHILCVARNQMGKLGAEPINRLMY